MLLALLFATWYLVCDAAPLSEWIDATANHYGGPQDGLELVDPFNPRVLLGGCNYGDLDPTEFPFYDVASFSPESSITTGLDQFGCGACFEVRCIDEPGACLGTAEGSSIVVVSSGTCGAGCGDRQVNLHVFAFDKLAPIRLGNIQIQLRQVTCEPIGNVVVLVKNYRADRGGYIKLVFRNIPDSGTLSAVQLKATDGDMWITLSNSFGAAWEGSQLPPPPLDLRLFESRGAELVIESVITEAGFEGDIDSGIQFSSFSSFPSSARSNFVDSAMQSPSPDASPVSGDFPTPFRVGASPSPAMSERPEVPLEDLDPALVTTSAGGTGR